MITVIIPSYRNPEYLDLCLFSIFNGESNKDKNEVIVVLDGFAEESSHIIKKYESYKSLKVLAFTNNTGFQQAVNFGVYNARNEKVFIINSDNVLPEDWDIILEENYVPNSVITVQQIEPGDKVKVGFSFIAKDFGTNANNFNYNDYIKFERSVKESSITNDGLLFPFLITKINYMRVGGFDTFYQSPNVCDWDFFLKLELIGINSFRTHAMALYHFGQKSTKNQDSMNEQERLDFINREQLALQQFQYKWNFLPVRGQYNTLIPERNVINGIRFK